MNKNRPTFTRTKPKNLQAKFSKTKFLSNSLKTLFTAYLLNTSLSLVAAHTQSNSNSNSIPSSTAPIIGIDLGTTYSCVAIYQNGQVEIIPNDQGNRITPSYVAFTDTYELLVGDAAKNQLTSNPQNTIFDIKRILGRKFDDPIIQNDAKFLPFTIVNQHNRPTIQIDADHSSNSQINFYSPEEISAMILTKMKETAENYLGQKITEAVVTVPAYFNDAQRAATIDAGKIAGLNIQRIINEPTAAAIAYGLNQNTEDISKNILVYDLGGGTFDVSLLEIADGVFEVLATNGDTHLGGEDFDQKVMQYFVEKYQKQTGLDVSGNDRSLQKLRREVEKAKRQLSTENSARIEIESFYQGHDFSEILTRAKFEELNQNLFVSTLGPVRQILADANLAKPEVDEIILVGGSTRIPKIRQILTDFFHGKNLNSEINPDEAVAYGAAVQAAILNGDNPELSETLVIDVTPLSLGIETVGGVMTKIIERNSAIPSKKQQIFSTAADNQEVVTISVYQGERALIRDNTLLGKFDLTGIPKAPRGQPQIEVSFEVDENGSLKVTAEEKSSSSSKSIVIENRHNRLSQAEIERMVRQAEMFQEEDQMVKERIEKRNELEGLVYRTKNQVLTQENLKLDQAEKETVLIKCEEVIGWLETTVEAGSEILEDKKLEFLTFIEPFFDQKLWEMEILTNKLVNFFIFCFKLKFYPIFLKFLVAKIKNLHRHTKLDNW